MSLLHGINYLHKSVLIFMTFLLSGFMLATGRVPALVSYQTVQKLGFLYAMLQICEFYRQRFYLNARQEWGLHWRVALLQYAKWPYFLMAFLDVLFNKEKPYELTEKVKSTLPKRPAIMAKLARDRIFGRAVVCRMDAGESSQSRLVAHCISVACHIRSSDLD